MRPSTCFCCNYFSDRGSWSCFCCSPQYLLLHAMTISGAKTVITAWKPIRYCYRFYFCCGYYLLLPSLLFLLQKPLCSRLQHVGLDIVVSAGAATDVVSIPHCLSGLSLVWSLSLVCLFVPSLLLSHKGCNPPRYFLQKLSPHYFDSCCNHCEPMLLLPRNQCNSSRNNRGCWIGKTVAPCAKVPRRSRRDSRQSMWTPHRRSITGKAKGTDATETMKARSTPPIKNPAHRSAKYRSRTSSSQWSRRELVRWPVQ